jgi:hypothetical protein
MIRLELVVGYRYIEIAFMSWLCCCIFVFDWYRRLSVVYTIGIIASIIVMIFIISIILISSHLLFDSKIAVLEIKKANGKGRVI